MRTPVETKVYPTEAGNWDSASFITFTDYGNYINVRGSIKALVAVDGGSATRTIFAAGSIPASARPNWNLHRVSYGNNGYMATFYVNVNTDGSLAIDNYFSAANLTTFNVTINAGQSIAFEFGYPVKL